MPHSQLIAVKVQILGGHRQLLLLLAPGRQPLGVGRQGQVLQANCDKFRAGYVQNFSKLRFYPKTYMKPLRCNLQ